MLICKAVCVWTLTCVCCVRELEGIAVGVAASGRREASLDPTRGIDKSALETVLSMQPWPRLRSAECAHESVSRSACLFFFPR